MQWASSMAKAPTLPTRRSRSKPPAAKRLVGYTGGRVAPVFQSPAESAARGDDRAPHPLSPAERGRGAGDPAGGGRPDRPAGTLARPGRQRRSREGGEGASGGGDPG